MDASREFREASPFSAESLLDDAFVFFREMGRGFRLAPDLLSPTQYHILTLIHERGSASLMELAGLLNVAGPTATRSVEALEQRGWVVKDRDPQDRRVIWLRLTASGQEVMQRERESQARYLARILERLTPEEQKLLGHLFQKLADGTRREVGWRVP